MTTKNKKPKLKDKKPSSEPGIKVHEDFKALFAKSGFKVDGVKLRHRHDKDKIVEGAAEYVENPSTLIEAVKSDPSVMERRGEVILALRIVQDIAQSPKSDDSKRAAEILREIGRGDLLPETPEGKPEKNKTDNPWLYLWTHNPSDLHDEVDECAERLLKSFESCPKKKMHKGKGYGVWMRECCLDYAFKNEVGIDRPGDYGRVTRTTTGDFLKLTALRFMSYKYRASFHSLYDLYYMKKEPVHKKKERQRLKALDKELGFKVVREEKESQD